jgi:hypothetical protein
VPTFVYKIRTYTLSLQEQHFIASGLSWGNYEMKLMVKSNSIYCVYCVFKGVFRHEARMLEAITRS